MEPFKFTKLKLLDLPLPPVGTQAEYRDSHVKGLRIRVGNSGKKTFCVVRKANNKFIRTSLGTFPELSVEMARTLALEKLGRISVTGQNPNDVKRDQIAAKARLGEALELYVKTRGGRLKPTTARQYRRTLSNFSGDWLERPIAEISRDDVQARHNAITEGTVWFGGDLSKMRAGVAGGSRAQADLWGRALRAICNFACDNYRTTEGVRLLPEPPTTVLSSKRQWHGISRKNTHIRSHDLARWLAAVESVRAWAMDSREDHIVACCDALEMALYTGLRRGEVFQLEWSRVDFHGRFFWIDKTKNGHPLELPTTETLMKIFKRRLAYRTDGQKLVFPSVKGGVITDPRRAIDLISKSTVPDINPDNLKAIKFKCHDTRRTFATIAGLAGLSSYVLKRLMNHRTDKSADVTLGYSHFCSEELRDAAERIEKYILNTNIDSDEGRINKVISDMSNAQKRIILEKLLTELKE
ncbi:site-specific integrase [Rahnella sp. ChDrAdgB13]|uniref:tyrosine-type recombinase/integrase n=1 Tax=Rahnella sp. ChDrAdgB13 TaxID=1850581 RepID=UPI001AD86404|nr:site-specific integrase [Rahnella sp. ChDrAdgB13]